MTGSSVVAAGPAGPPVRVRRRRVLGGLLVHHGLLLGLSAVAAYPVALSLASPAVPAGALTMARTGSDVAAVTQNLEQAARSAPPAGFTAATVALWALAVAAQVPLLRQGRWVAGASVLTTLAASLWLPVLVPAETGLLLAAAAAAAPKNDSVVTTKITNEIELPAMWPLVWTVALVAPAGLIAFGLARRRAARMGN